MCGISFVICFIPLIYWLTSTLEYNGGVTFCSLILLVHSKTPLPIQLSIFKSFSVLSEYTIFQNITKQYWQPVSSIIKWKQKWLNIRNQTPWTRFYSTISDFFFVFIQPYRTFNFISISLAGVHFFLSFSKKKTKKKRNGYINPYIYLK